MQKNEYREFRRLRNDGWLVGDESVVRWNAGGESETLKHMTVKQLAATACLRNGYSIGTEVARENGNSQIDVLAYASDRLNWAIEVETCAYEDILAEKQQKYVSESHYIDEMQVIELETLPDDIESIYEVVRRQLGFEQ
jgi:hypothetical protein